MLFSAVRRTLALLVLLGIITTLAFLPFAGRFLVAEDPIEPSDALFVLAGTKAERFLEAVDLYQAHVAPRIVLSAGRLEDAEILLRQRGVNVQTDAEIARDAIVQLQVPATAVTILPGSVDNTAQEAAALRSLATAEHWHTVTVITSRFHSRRSGFAFRRAFDGSGVRILIRTTHYDTADPARWWQHRADIRFVSSELEKLVLYRLGLAE